ncbi:MAG TPA: glutaredoxin domain-containing protein [Lacisediminihabitans sp.]|jgi:glutaredoxin-like protein|nr:glutaredoxin domain-containing protein [Lacisediminihabitans sp.]HXD60677.1 glutaredoxin domain-containing protein [Lacisediminihabitans sp.]
MSERITMYGAEWCGDCRRSKKLLDELGVDYDYVDLEADVAAADVARGISGRTNIPVIAFPDGTHVVEPSNDELRDKLAALGA